MPTTMTPMRACQAAVQRNVKVELPCGSCLCWHRFYKMAKGAAKILVGKKSPKEVSGDTRVALKPAECPAEPELKKVS